MADQTLYDYQAPRCMDCAFKKFEESASAAMHYDSINVSRFSDSGMEVDLACPRSAQTGRASSTPRKDCCIQTAMTTDEEEKLLSEALETLLSLGWVARRSGRFSKNVDVRKLPSNVPFSWTSSPAGENPEKEKKQVGKFNPSSKNGKEPDEENLLKRQTTSIAGQRWHQALKYRRFEHKVATSTPKLTKKSRGLISDSKLNLGSSWIRRTPQTTPRTIDVKASVTPKTEVKVEPFKLTEYKPRQCPLEDSAKVFQRQRDTRVKIAVRRLEEKEAPRSPQFRARRLGCFNRDPFVPKPVEKTPTKPEPFILQTEKRARLREQFDQKVLQHQLEQEYQRALLAAERQRQEALEIKELRRVKIHARPVPAFYQQFMLKK